MHALYHRRSNAHTLFSYLEIYSQHSFQKTILEWKLADYQSLDFQEGVVCQFLTKIEKLMIQYKSNDSWSGRTCVSNRLDSTQHNSFFRDGCAHSRASMPFSVSVRWQYRRAIFLCNSHAHRTQMAWRMASVWRERKFFHVRHMFKYSPLLATSCVTCFIIMWSVTI